VSESSSSNQADSVVRANLSSCLHSLRFYNAVLDDMKRTRSTVFDATNSDHLAMLEGLWNDLIPETRRSPCDITATCSNPLASSSWGDIGFQGKDPATDCTNPLSPRITHLSNS
jgi:hypothetical protein